MLSSGFENSQPSHSSYLPAYEVGTECSETSAYKIQKPGNYPAERIQHEDLIFDIFRTTDAYKKLKHQQVPLIPEHKKHCYMFRLLFIAIFI